VDRVVSRDTRDQPPRPDQMVLRNGTWVPVASVDAVGAGQAVRFTSGAVEGFVVNRGGTIQAMSAVCTHMGCILKFNQSQERLDCPCHGASFNLDGSPLSHAYLSSLPTLRSRVRGGTIEVEVPAQA
jgi:nitrite reductase/ring-hydroxylating ferredoxin subunit